MNFHVDSPAAWAAEIHNCTLLDRTVSVKRSLLESADATCALLKRCSNEMLSLLCGSITYTGFGGRAVYVPEKGTKERLPPLLPPQGVLNVLACMMNFTHYPCQMPRNWSHDNAGILHLKHYGAKVPVKAFVRQLEEMEEKKGLAWLQTMEITSSQSAQCSDPNDSPSAAEFDREVARTAWEVSRISALPKVLRILGFWKESMPQLLLDELVASHRMDIKELKTEPSLREIFKEVKISRADLADAADLRLSILALNLAENLENLTLNCFRCGDFGSSPAAQDWEDLSHQLTQVRHLQLDHFVLRYPGTLLKHARSLTTLALAHDQITTLPEDVFRNLSSLTTLDLNNNQITKVPEDVFRNLSSLETLDLENNHLAKLPDRVFRNLSSLETLRLGFNQFTTVPKKVFRDLSSLKMLRLRVNKLTMLPEKVFQDLSSLKSLDLNYNQITKVPEDVFRNLSSLETLDLENNHLAKLPDRAFRNLSSLETLGLCYNQITTVPKKVFRDLSSLKMLGLCVNKLTMLPEKVFQGLSSLKSLDLNGNQITKVPEDVFRNLSSLETLGLCYNQITTLPEKVFHGLSSLQTLELNENQITTLPERVFRDLSSLKMLGLSRNELSKDDIQSLRSNLTSLGVKIEF